MQSPISKSAAEDSESDDSDVSSPPSASKRQAKSGQHNYGPFKLNASASELVVSYYEVSETTLRCSRIIAELKADITMLHKVLGASKHLHVGSQWLSDNGYAATVKRMEGCEMLKMEPSAPPPEYKDRLLTRLSQRAAELKDLSGYASELRWERSLLCNAAQHIASKDVETTIIDSIRQEGQSDDLKQFVSVSPDAVDEHHRWNFYTRKRGDADAGRRIASLASPDLIAIIDNMLTTDPKQQWHTKIDKTGVIPTSMPWVFEGRDLLFAAATTQETPEAIKRTRALVSNPFVTVQNPKRTQDKAQTPSDLNAAKRAYNQRIEDKVTSEDSPYNTVVVIEDISRANVDMRRDLGEPWELVVSKKRPAAPKKNVSASKKNASASKKKTKKEPTTLEPI